MDTIEIHTDFIQMDQLLKWAGVVDSGGQVKFMLEEQQLLLNGALVTEKRKKVYPGDIVEIKGCKCLKVVKKQGA